MDIRKGIQLRDSINCGYSFSMPNYHFAQTTKNRDAIVPILPKFIIRYLRVASIFTKKPPLGTSSSLVAGVER
jgi:hypothetical protein